MAEVDKIILSDGLVNQDSRLDHLSNLFEQLQVVTVDAADPALDLITFSQNAAFFSVILKKQPQVELPAASTEIKDWVDDTPVTSTDINYWVDNTPVASTKAKKQWANNTPVDSTEVKQWEPKKKRKKRSSKKPLFLPPAQNSNKRLQFDFDSSEIKFIPEGRDNHFDPPLPPQRVDYLDDPPFHEPHVYDPFTFPLTWDPSSSAPSEDAIGLAYLVPASFIGEPLHPNEYNIGIILAPEYQGQGHAQRAIELVLNRAFTVLNCHRVQAILPDHVAKDRAICFFTSMGFAHEGVRRRAFLSPIEGEYKDVTYMGILDMDWIVRGRRSIRSAPKSVWDELFARHQREREELLNWESNLRRTASMGTIRAQTPIAVSEPDSGTEDSSKAHRPFEKGKKNADTSATWRRSSEDVPPDSESESYHSSVSSGRSETPEGYDSSTSWNVVNPSSPSSASFSFSEAESGLESVDDGDSDDMARSPLF